MTKTVLLGDVGRIVTGKTPPAGKPDWWGSELDFSTPSDFENDSKFLQPKRKLSLNGRQSMDNLECPADSVMVTCIGSDMGKVAVCRKPTITNQQINTVIPDTTICDPEFLYYSLKSKSSLLKSLARSGGSTMPIINKSTFSKITLALPTLKEQKEIAKILGDLDAKIELNQRMNETLERVGQTLFKHYFIDNSGSSSWPKFSLKTMGEIVCGKTPSKKHDKYFGGGIPFIKIPDMHNQVYIVNSQDKLSKLGHDSQIKKTLPPETVCVSCIATVGLVSLTAKQSQTNQQINSIIPARKYFTYFLYFLMKHLKPQLRDMASGGSATLNLNTSSFANMNVNVPDNELLSKFDKEVRPLFNQILTNQHQTTNLVILRDSLLPRLISGKLKL